MEKEKEFAGLNGNYWWRGVMSPEIVEINEERKGMNNNNNDVSIGKEVYVAVGKDDMEVLRWALHNAVSPDTSSLFLIHVFPPISYIPTPVGRLSKSQVSTDQWRSHVNQENLRRRNILQKYICLCADSKVMVETVLIESDMAGKAILELIPVLNITRLVMGRKRSSHRRLKIGSRKSDNVQRHAPKFCDVTIICDGKIVTETPPLSKVEPSSPKSSSKNCKAYQPERNFFECTCFSGGFNEEN